MNELKIFTNKTFGELEVLVIDNKEWFGAIPTAKMLGYSNPYKAVIDHCRGDGLTIREVIDSLGRNQKKKFINEGNLYRLITKSKLPSAEKFEKWVFDDILPSIRKHGMYVVDDLLNNPDLAIKAFSALKEEREKRIKLELENKELKPKAELADTISSASNLLNFSQTAKSFGIGRNKLFEILRKEGILLTNEYNKNIPKQSYITQGYFRVIITPRKIKGEIVDLSTSLITPKGLNFIHKILKNNGLLKTQTA